MGHSNGEVKMISRSISVSVCALVFVFSVFPSFAQTSGSFTGTVVDDSNAAVVSAQVSVSDPKTGLHRKASTNSDGNYLIAGLDAGTYDVTVTRSWI
jgi:hypothetical protein